MQSSCVSWLWSCRDWRLTPSIGKIGAIVLGVPIIRARALLNGLAPVHRPAPFGEADAAERQPEFAQLLQGARLLEPGIKRSVRQGEAIAEHIRPPSGELCHYLVLEKPHAIEHLGSQLPSRLLFPCEDEAVRRRIKAFIGKLDP